MDERLLEDERKRVLLGFDSNVGIEDLVDNLSRTTGRRRLFIVISDDEDEDKDDDAGREGRRSRVSSVVTPNEDKSLRRGNASILFVDAAPLRGTSIPMPLTKELTRLSMQRHKRRNQSRCC